MGQAFFSFIYSRLLGWKSDVTVDYPDKCVICAAPHTSNWDLLLGKLFCATQGKKVCFMMKKEWFFFPLGMAFRAMGGIAVDRQRKGSLVDQMVGRFARSRQFYLAITPEGTRKANPDWKKGFYYIAFEARVPVLLIGIDYPSRTISCNRIFVPTGDVEKDMREVKIYFTRFRGKHQDRFSTGIG